MSRDNVRGHVTIEKTGKWLKLQQIVAFLLFVVGLIVLMVAAGSREPGSTEVPKAFGNGAAMAGIGFVWMMVVRFLSWWNHG